ncbi:MAG: hypothetical protein ABIK36_16235 [Pseudomonadota bacterium]
MQLAAILQRLDAQERRLTKLHISGDELFCDYRFVTHDGDDLVPFDDDTPDDAIRISITVIPCGKFLKPLDVNMEHVEREYRAAPTGETYHTFADDECDVIEVTRHRISVVPVLVDAPPEPPMPTVEVTDKQPVGMIEALATGGAQRPPASPLRDDAAALAAIEQKLKARSSTNAWVQEQLDAWSSLARM